jgi:hypothetical protein
VLSEIKSIIGEDDLALKGTDEKFNIQQTSDKQQED